MKELISHKELLELLNYNPITGEFRWNSGRIAGTIVSKGGRSKDYCVRRIRIKKNDYLEHRLAWFYMKGEWPEKEIDHKNRISTDNRWINLRMANRFINNQNRIKARKDSKTGCLGVCRTKNNKFSAKITINGKINYLGTFLTKEEASRAYFEAKNRLQYMAQARSLF